MDQKILNQIPLSGYLRGEYYPYCSLLVLFASDIVRFILQELTKLRLLFAEQYEQGDRC